LFALFFLAAWLLGAVSGQARCADAARVGARLAARGESDTAVTAAVARAAPPHAGVRLRRHDGLLDVEVSARVGRIGLDRLVPDLVVSAHAVVPVEAAVVGSAPVDSAPVDSAPAEAAPADPPLEPRACAVATCAGLRPP
jgi:hypothetical protein